MNNLEKNIIDVLSDLYKNYHVRSVKAEFEAEGAKFEEVLKLKTIVKSIGLGLCLKISGAEAIRDLYDARAIGVSSVIAPMIETPYAMKKFVKAIKAVFLEEERKNIGFYINIETITGFNNLNDIISSKEFAEINGIVLGRTDMIGSLGLEKYEIDSDSILNIAKIISNKLLYENKIFTIGGGISPDSVSFLKKIIKLDNFETRKVIFEAKPALNNLNIEQGIRKALEFETLWLKYKKEFNGVVFESDEKRLELLNSMLRK